MVDPEEECVRGAMLSLVDLKHAFLVLLRRDVATRADFDDVMMAVDFLEWIGATVATVYPPVERRFPPDSPAAFLRGSEIEPTLDSMSQNPPFPDLSERRPGLRRSSFLAQPEPGRLIRRKLFGVVLSLQTCRADVAVATCARIQQFYEAIGGTSAAVARADQEYDKRLSENSHHWLDGRISRH